MTAVYDKYGIRFQYPENWRLEQRSGPQPPIEVNIDAPQGGFWSLHAFPIDSDASDLLARVETSLRDQYDSLEIEPTKGRFGNVDVDGFQAQFYCLDFLVSATAWVAQTDRYTFTCLYQAESREFDQFEMVFRAITTSLLSNASQQPNASRR